jgi:hypothetical protein
MAVAMSYASSSCLADEVRVISSDATPEARRIALGLNKSLVIEMPRDVKNVLMAGNAKIKGDQQHLYPITVVPMNKRQMSIVGTNVGTGSVYFFDERDRPIIALVVDVAINRQFYPPTLKNSSLDADATQIQVYRGMDHFTYWCKPDLNDGCGWPAPQDEPSNTTHSDITIRGDAGSIVSVPAGGGSK